MDISRLIVIPVVAVTAAFALAGCGAVSAGGGSSASVSAGSSASASSAASAPASASASASAPASSAPAGSATVAKPCDAVPASFVSGILGKQATASAQQVDGVEGCVYLAGQTPQFIIAAKPGTRAQYDSTIAQAAKKGETGTSVPGYGESAEQYAPTKERGAVMIVFDKGVVFTVISPRAPIEQLEQIAAQYDKAL